MPEYQIYRLRESYRKHFRWAIEAPTPYAAWFALRNTEHPLEVGDLLASPGGGLHICKYVGFEQARWASPGTEAAPEAEPVTVKAPVARTG